MQYRVLGPLEVVRGDEPVELGGPKQRAALAVLLLEAGRVVPTDRLVDAVWGDDQPLSVAASLQAYVSNLRRVLRDDATATSPIVRQQPGYRLDVSADQIDVTHFLADADRAHAAVLAREWSVATQAAEQALARWRGPLLTDLQDEEWVRVAAAGLEERRSECVEDLVTALLGSGRSAQALGLARTLYAEQPLRERACWLYVVALYRAGRTTNALDVYRAHVRRLDDELGLEPGAALRDLQGAILRQDADLLAWPGQPVTEAPGVVEPEMQPADPEPDVFVVDHSALVGRTRELGHVDALLDEVRAGAVRWLVLTGPAGIGKSRLAEEAVTRALAAGARVVRAGCPDDDGLPPWWPIRQLVDALGADAQAVLTQPADADADGARFAVYGRVQALIAAATAHAPLLVLVDDVQWADPTSVRFLTHLASATGLARLAVVLTARDGAGGAGLQRLLATAARREGTRQLAVPPLAAAEVAQLVTRVSGESVDPDEARLLTARTGGNPFFVSEYARLPVDERRSGELPLAVRSVLGRRLAGLDPAVLQVLRTAAVIGETLDVDLLRTLTRLDAEGLADLLDDAADERIIVAAPGSRTYMFAHGLLRDEVLAGMSDVRRQRQHARVAEAIGPGGTTDQLVRRAAHLVAALPLAEPTDAYEACRAAATDAEQRWNSDSAAHWWGAALQVYDQLPAAVRSDSDHDELVIAQVAALARAGRGQTVLDVVDAALVDAVREGRTRSAGRLARTLLRTAGAWPWASYGEDPGPLLARLGAVEPLMAGDPGAHAQVLAALAVGSCYHPDARVPDTLSRRALELAEQIGDADILADALLGRALTFSGVANRAQESIRLLARLAALPHDYERLDAVLRHGLLSMAHATLGDVDAADEHRRLGVAGSDLLRLPVSRVQFRWAEGMFAQWRGDFADAEALYAHAYAMHQQTELYRSGVHEIAILALRWDQGRLHELSDPDMANRDFLPWELAVITAARGHADEADRLITAELAVDEPPTWTTHGKLTMLAHLVADLGLRSHAPTLLQRLDALRDCVATIGQVGIVGPIALALARLSLLVDDRPAARRQLDLAVELSVRAGGRSSILRCRLLAAQLAGNETDEFARIADEAERMGLSGVARAARRAG